MLSAYGGTCQFFSSELPFMVDSTDSSAICGRLELLPVDASSNAAYEAYEGFIKLQ